MGGITINEIGALANFERQMIVKGAWTSERIVIGSVPIQGQKSPIISAEEMMGIISQTQINKKDIANRGSMVSRPSCVRDVKDIKLILEQSSAEVSASFSSSSDPMKKSLNKDQNIKSNPYE